MSDHDRASAPMRTVGWGPFRLRGEARRLAAAEDSARRTMDMLSEISADEVSP